MIFTPREYQELAVDHILSTPRCAIWAGMGMGKTSATLYALDCLRYVEKGPALVIAPLRVAQSVWPEEAAKWSAFQRMGVCPIMGGVEARKKALRQAADVHTINYEMLPWLVEAVGDKWPWTTIVADESTRLKSFRLRAGGRRARALSQVAWSHAHRFIELTGTPAPNGLQDLWGQLWFLDRGERLGRTHGAFINRWFRMIQCQGFRKFDGPLPGAQEEIHKKCRDICLSLRAQDYFDLQEPIIVDVPIDLPPLAQTVYKGMEKTMFAELQDGAEVEALNAAAKTIKCLQLANGAIYTDDSGAWSPIHDAKLTALESIVEEAAGMPVLVAYHFKSDLARLKKYFPAGRELDKNPKTISDWNKGRIPIMFAHPASAGHGLNLQDGGNIVVMLGHWWDLEQYQQIIERIGPVRQMQAGHNRPVFIYNIVARNTVDETVIARRQSKRSVQDLLLEAARRSH